MFETIQKQGGSGGPQWLSSHPNPGNRTAVHRPGSGACCRSSPREVHAAEFTQARGLFASLPPAQSMAELERTSTAGGAPPAGAGPRAARRRSAESVNRCRRPRAVPDGAGRQAVRGSGAAELDSRVLEQRRQVRAAERLRRRRRAARASSRTASSSASRAPPRATSPRPRERSSAISPRATRICARPPKAQDIRLSQRSGLGLSLVNRSHLGGTERIGIYTTLLADGNLFYMATIVPDGEAERYGPVFDRIARSIRLRDAR